MLSLGLDPSLTSFGWVITDQGKFKMAGTIATPAHTPLILRFIQIRTVIQELLDKNNVSVVGLESPAFYGETSLMLYGLYSILLELAVENQLFLVEFTPQTLKYLAGVKSTGKKEIVAAAKQQIGTSRTLKSDLADAFFVSYFGFRFCQLYNNDLFVRDLSPHEKMSFLSEQRNDKGRKKGILFRENDMFYDFKKVNVYRRNSADNIMNSCIRKDFSLEEIIHGKTRQKTKGRKGREQQPSVQPV